MFERLLEPDSTELPSCQCGSEMHMAELRTGTGDALVKVFECAACHREMQLMVWNRVPTTPADEERI